MSKVKCSVCGQQFDKDKTEWVKTSSTRYAHKSCGEPFLKQKELEQREAADKKQLEEYIKQIYRIQNLSPLMRQQIRRFHDECGMTYSGMAGTLVYFYQVLGNTTEKARGVGILEYVYLEAQQYYANLAKVNLANQGQDFNIQTHTITIPVPQRKKKKKRFFKFLEEDN